MPVHARPLFVNVRPSVPPVSEALVPKSKKAAETDGLTLLIASEPISRFSWLHQTAH
jgi:hypothetical protein